MRKLGVGIVGIFVVGLVVLAGCTSSGTASVKPPAPAPTQTSLASGDASRGKMIYVSLCYGCHAREAKVGPSFASEEFKSKYHTADALVKVVRTGRHPMPHFSREQLSDQGLADLMAYVKAAN